MYLAEELITPGGPSAPAWAFFTAISLALIGILGQQVAARKEAKEAKVEASKASESASKTEENTARLGNGFVNRMDLKLDRIADAQTELGKALRDHLEWHLDNPSQDRK